MSEFSGTIGRNSLSQTLPTYCSSCRGIGAHMGKINSIDWNVYPKHILDEIKRYRRNKNVDISKTTLPKFVFLCGQDINTNNGGNRKLITDLYSRIRKDIICVYSEKLFTTFGLNMVDLLSFEELLAELSDGIILLIESYGTACELGAFAMMPELLDKLLIINGSEHEGKSTFINDGPIRKVKNLNEEHVLFTQMDSLLANDVIFNSLENFIDKDVSFKVNHNEGAVRLDSLVYEVLELIELFQPVSKDQLLPLYKYLKEFNSFTYFSSKKNTAIRNIGFTKLIDLLDQLDLIDIKNEYVEIKQNQSFEYQNISFIIPNHRYNRLRARLISKKFRKGIYDLREGVEEYEFA